MIAYYWDASAIAAFLFDERFSEVIRAYNRPCKALRGFLSVFSELELESVFQRRFNRGELVGVERQDFRAQLKGLLSNMAIIYPDVAMVGDAKRLISEYSLRSGDALQLATARTLARKDERVVFLTFDDKLSRSAEAEGLEAPFHGKT